MKIDEYFLKHIEVYVKIQNIQLLKYIAINEGWDYILLCKKYL